MGSALSQVLLGLFTNVGLVWSWNQLIAKSDTASRASGQEKTLSVVNIDNLFCLMSTLSFSLLPVSFDDIKEVNYSTTLGFGFICWFITCSNPAKMF